MNRTHQPHHGGVTSKGEKTWPDAATMIENAHRLFDEQDIGAFLQQLRQIHRLPEDAQQSESMELSLKYNQLGILLFENGYKKDALAIYEKAYAIYTRLKAEEDANTASIYNNLGQVHHALHNVDQAIDYLKKSLKLRQAISPDSIDHAVACDNLAAVYASIHDLERAEELHNKALVLFERLGGPLSSHTATALGNLGNLFFQRGDYQKAEAYCLRALDTHEQTGGFQDSAILLDIAMLAVIQLKKGNDQRVDHYINLLLSIGERATRKEQRYVAERLRQVMKTAFNEFRLDLAERLGHEAVRLLMATEGETADDTLEAIFLLGNVQRATRHYQPALESYQRALEGYRRLNRPVKAVAASIEIAKIHRDRGGYPVAQQIFETVIDQLKKMPEAPAQQLVSAMGNLADLYFLTDQTELADDMYCRALAKIDGGAAKVERPQILHNWAMLSYHTADYGTAIKRYEEARELWGREHGYEHPFVATTAANLALAYWSSGDMDSAVRNLDAAETLRDREMRKIIAVGSETKRMAYARELQSDLYKVVSLCMQAAQDSRVLAEFAARILLRRKGLVLDAIAHTTTQIQQHLDAHEQTIFNRLRGVRKAISDLMAPTLIHRRPVTDRERVRLLRDEEECLEAELSYKGALFQSTLETVSIADIQESLPSGGALVEILRYSVFNPVRTGKTNTWGEDRYAVMVLHSNGSPCWFDLGKTDDIDQQADQLMRCLRNDRSGMEAYHKAANALYRSVIGPMQGSLQEAEHLLISPDGHLSTVPLGLLVDNTGQRLSCCKTVSYLNSGRELIALREFTGAGKGIVVVADPDFDAPPSDMVDVENRQSLKRQKLAPLPGARQEGEQIKASFEGVSLLSGRQATYQAVAGISSPSILHFATHGVFNELDEPDPEWEHHAMPVGDELMLISHATRESYVNPMFYSGLALCGANHRETRGDAGVMTAQEIAGLNLGGTDLVVLSACETGLGITKRGEEFMGLRRALAIAGAATQVTSLWRVEDQATQTLMGHYYRHLSEGLDKTRALVMAQSEVENDPDNPHWSHPYFWGAFISSGDWRPLKKTLTVRNP